jgi:beta-N-acetylhexosaminidase
MARAFISGCSGLSLTPEERDFFAATQPWGLILFGRNIGDSEQIRALVADFRRCVQNPSAPVLIDQEGGRVQRIKPPLAEAHPPAAVYGAMFERDPAAAIEAARLGATLIGAELRGYGIDVDCLPVLDLLFPGADKVIGDRAYGAQPEVVAQLGAAAMQGLLAAGVLPVVKHMPGHGRAGADSHYALPRVTVSRADLEAADFAPFRALADAPLAMTAHVLYESIDPDRPATISPAVIADAIRGSIGFDGLLMTDDISMRALGGGIAERGAAALAAGCDMLLHCNGKMDEMHEVASVAPPLAGEAGRRAEAALALISGRPAPDPGPLRGRYRELFVGA